MTDEFLRRWSRKKSEANRNIKRKSVIQDRNSEQVSIADDFSHSPPSNALMQKPDKSEISNLKTEHVDSDTENRSETKSDLISENNKESDFDDVDFEALSFDSDYTQFMHEGVPEAIQRKALRKLWASNPILANIDGLNDYDEDFTDAALAVDVIKTAYKVGSGYLTEEEQEEPRVEEDELLDSDGEFEPASKVAGSGESDVNQKQQADREDIAVSEESVDRSELNPEQGDPDKNRTA